MTTRKLPPTGRSIDDSQTPGSTGRCLGDLSGATIFICLSRRRWLPIFFGNILPELLAPLSKDSWEPMNLKCFRATVGWVVFDQTSLVCGIARVPRMEPAGDIL